MQLTDGMVMDFTKSSAPVMDHRWQPGYVEVQQAPIVTVNPNLVPEFSEPLTESTIINVPATTGPLTPQTTEPYDPWRHAKAAQAEFDAQTPQILQPFMAPLQPFPSFPSIQTWPQTIDVVRDKINQRREALLSIETDSPEVRYTVKTLDWVLQEITKACTVYVQGNVTVTNAAP